MQNSSGLNLFNKNLIRGGNFDTSPWTWQEAISSGSAATGRTGVTVSANGDLIPDGWIAGGATTAAATTFSVQSDAPTFAQAGIDCKKCMQIAVTTADASVAAGDLYFFGTMVDRSTAAQLSTSPMTLSFWVKTNKTGVYTIRFAWAGSSNQIYAAEYTVNSSNTWEYKTITVTTPSVVTAPGQGVALKINFNLMAGSTYHITANTWTTYSLTNGATSNQVNFLDSTSNTFKIALVQLEKGSVATPFDYRAAAEERYLFEAWVECGLKDYI
ncbi:MAG: hypothetical protein K5Q00_04660, partial [Gammaproteobacteria bacterium]|nr:hypothetical protein [Gammaproteobacteria bacterium]